MARAFEDRILEERKKLRVPVEDLKKRVKASPFGPESQKILERLLNVESNCQVGFSLWSCPPVIKRGKGATVFDVDGKRYIDLIAGFSVNNVGLCNPEVVEAIKRQAEELIHYFDLPNVPRVELSEKIVKITPGDFPKKVIYTVTGSEAVEVAIRLARWYTGKQFVLNPYCEYHGVTIGTMGLTGKAGIRAYYYPLLPAENGILHFPYAYCYRCPYGKEYPACDIQCIKFLEELFENKESPFRNPANGVHNVAAILVEPMLASGGYIIPPDEFLLGLENICRKYDILFIVDEVQSGMGRSGKMWAIQHSGATPDMIPIAKSIAGGIPLSMVVGREEIMDSWGPGAHLATFAATPLACAAANKVLEIMGREGFFEGVNERAGYLLDGLLELKKRHPIVGDVSGKGFFIGVEFVKDRKTKAPAAEEASFMLNECFKEGLIVQRSGFYFNRFNLIPPLVISREEIEEVLKIFDVVFGRAEQKFGIR